MSARMFGRGEEAATATTTAPGATSDATFNIRGWAGVMFIGGVLMCLVPPVTALGAVCAVLGGVVWLLAPRTEPAAQQMAAQSSEGGGCGAALWAVVLVAAIGTLAGVLMIAAGLAVNGGGL